MNACAQLFDYQRVIWGAWSQRAWNPRKPLMFCSGNQKVFWLHLAW